jgi:hypothetical protein
MEKVLVTAASGRHRRLLDIALPSFSAFCRAQGYSILIDSEPEASGRPASWGKVPLLRRMVEEYDVVLWVDVDAVILRHDRDPLLDVDPAAFQGLVDWSTTVGMVPNCGVWLLRGGGRSARFLDEVWAQTSLIDHPWWEQAAVAALLGRLPVDPDAQGGEWAIGTSLLPPEWNAVSVVPGMRIHHCAGMAFGDRRAQMRADAAQLRGRQAEAAVRRRVFRAAKSARYRAGLVVRERRLR